MEIKNILRILVILLASVFFKPAYSQEINIKSKFIIQDAKHNDEDISENWIKGKAYLAFYTIQGSEEIYFASVNPGQNSKSYGRVFNLKHSKENESANNYENQTFTFSWSYINSYDDNKGTAKVKIIQMKKNNGVGFMCSIVTENLDQIVFKGHMTESLKY